MHPNREQKNYLDAIEQRLFEKYGNERKLYQGGGRTILQGQHGAIQPQAQECEAKTNSNVSMPQVYKIELPTNSKHIPAFRPHKHH